MPPKPEKRGGAGFWMLLCFLCLGIGAGLGVVGVHLHNKENRRQNGENVSDGASEPNDLSRPVVALGRIEPKDGTLSLGVPTPDRIASIRVNEGVSVKEGEVLAVLDSAVLREQERKMAVLHLKDAKLRREAVKASGEAKIRVEEIHRDQVEQLEPFELESLDSKIAFLQDQEKEARKNVERYQKVADTIAEQDREKQSLALNQVHSELIAARSQRQKLLKTREMNRSLAAAQLEAARAELKQAESAISLDLLEQQIAQAEERVKDSRIQAPSGGTILRILMRKGELVHGQPILQMANTDKMIVIAEVPDTEARRVHVGQDATITRTGIFGDKKDEVTGKAADALTGKVVSVGSSVGKPHVFDVDPRAAMDNRVIEVKVELDQSAAVAKLIGLQVRVTIHTTSGEGSR